jgi:polyphenol oxidase
MIESLPIVRPSAFGHGAGITAGLSTRNGGPDGSPFGMNLSFNVGDDADHVTRNRTLFFGALGIGMHELAFMQQVHGSTVTRVQSPGVYPACDGMITDEPRLFLSVTVADCVPVFILDPAVHALAVVHAGWRGTAAHIVGKAIEALGVAYGALPSRMEAFVGPAAGGCCYEVGAEVAGAIDSAFVTVRNGRLFADLKACNTAQLKAGGVPAKSIESHPGCTIHEKALFHSYRRDSGQSGRMIGVAGFSARS